MCVIRGVDCVRDACDSGSRQCCCSKVARCVITDSRNVYDKLRTEVLSIKETKKESNIELLSLKEAQARTKVIMRWVHSEAQLGNSLTKHNANKELELVYQIRSTHALGKEEAH